MATWKNTVAPGAALCGKKREKGVSSCVEHDLYPEREAENGRQAGEAQHMCLEGGLPLGI